MVAGVAHQLDLVRCVDAISLHTDFARRVFLRADGQATGPGRNSEDLSAKADYIG